MDNRCYFVIDLKSFYASVECVDRELDPLTAKLVVADASRGRGTICLAITPAMKKLGIKNRCRLHEIPSSIDYIIAPPRMKRYIDMSAEIYAIYLKYISGEDIHVYSIDEAFLDVTSYLKLYKATGHELALRIMEDITITTKGLIATCGIGTNMYLAKVALDILAKHSPDFIAELDENSYKERLWRHRPLTDFWRIGRGIARRLSSMGIYTQEDIAKADEKMLLKKFGAGAEYLIDHAWGREHCTIDEIKHYENKSHSLSCGQVLMRDYTYSEALTVVKEMANELSLDMTAAHVVSCGFSLYIGYTFDSFSPTGGSMTINETTNSVRIITDTFVSIYRRTTLRDALIRRINLCAMAVVDECYEQYSFFTNPEIMEKDRSISRSVNSIKEKYGKNAILKGTDLLPEATQRQRNMQIGGHRAGEVI